MTPDPKEVHDPGDESEQGALLALSSDMLATIGFDGRLKTLNASWKSLLGYEHRELVSTRLLDLIHSDDHTGTAEALLKAACGEGGHAVLVNRCRCRDGSHKWLSWRLKALPAKQLYYAAASDVSHHKDLVQKMLQCQKMAQVGRMVAGVAHDFNNILAAIQCCATMLIDSNRLAQEDRRDIADILRMTRQGTALVRGLLDYSRADKSSEGASSDVQECFARMESLLRHLIPEGIEFSPESTGVAAKVRIGSSRLDQIILNLVINARDAMPDGGRIELRASKREGYARISVSDTGTGIPPDVQTRLGEPFFTTKAEGKGMGLGLATVTEIVVGCGGRIDVRSAPGSGTTFEISLPLVEE